jgi:hypothetical protein
MNDKNLAIKFEEKESKNEEKELLDQIEELARLQCEKCDVN